MSLSSLQLDAFTEVARLKSFSQAAAKLHVTQSALSQRVLNLEQELGSSLFVRDPAGLRLTDLGHRLLRFCHSKNLLESEFMETLKAKDSDGLSGILRISGYSTVTRSMVMPLLSGFLKKNPEVNLEIRTEELRVLPKLLFSGVSDLIFVNEAIQKQGVENQLLGYEEYVMVQSTGKVLRPEIYLDNDEDDTITQDFFKTQGRKLPILKRNFLGDVYAIIDGVKLGMGRAVIPLHMIDEMRGVEVVKGYAPMKVPVYLSYYGQAFFTQLQTTVTDTIVANAKQFLSIR